MWSSHSKGRKHLRALFPEFPVELEFEVLGTKMYTCSRKAFHYDLGVRRQILADIANIGALRIPALKSLLVSPCQKVNLDRSKMPSFVLCGMGNPNGEQNGWFRPFTVNHTGRNNAPSQPHSLWARLQHACSVLDVTIASQPFALDKLQPRELKPLLVQLARQAAYQSVDHRTRKDFVQPQGLLDFRATTRFLMSDTASNLPSLQHVASIRLSQGVFWPMTGCQPQDGQIPPSVDSAFRLRSACPTLSMSAVSML